MNGLRPDIVNLLHAGLSDRAIGRQLRCDPRTVSRTRATLGLPQVRCYANPASSIEELFWERVEPVEGGHLRWTGYRGDGTPRLTWGGRLHTAYRIAFRIRTGREPVGYVLPGCEYPRCVAPRCVADAVERERTRRVLAAIFREAAA